MLSLNKYIDLERQLIRSVARADEWCDVVHSLELHHDVTARVSGELRALGTDLKRISTLLSHWSDHEPEDGSQDDFNDLYRKLSSVKVDAPTDVEEVRHILRDELHRYLVILELSSAQGSGAVVHVVGDKPIGLAQFIHLVLFIIHNRLTRLDRLKVAMLMLKSREGVID